MTWVVEIELEREGGEANETLVDWSHGKEKTTSY